ncbi:MAG: ferritin-like domain-containing protein [Polyangiales bacterium]
MFRVFSGRGGTGTRLAAVDPAWVSHGVARSRARIPSPGDVMGQGSNSLHEEAEQLTAEVIDRHRAIQSLMEELEAVDWYDQRVSACKDDELRAILAHNRDEEKEHAAMVLEWLRRNDPGFAKHLKTYLFSEGSIIGREEDEKEEGGKEESAPEPKRSKPHGASLNIGTLRKAVGK